MSELENQESSESSSLNSGSLLDEILSESKLAPQDEGYDVAKRGVQAFIAELLTPARSAEKIDRALVDTMIAELDARLSSQVDEIIHTKEFQTLESSWQGLKFTVDRVDFRENVRVELVASR